MWVKKYNDFNVFENNEVMKYFLIFMNVEFFLMNNFCVIAACVKKSSYFFLFCDLTFFLQKVCKPASNLDTENEDLLKKRQHCFILFEIKI